MLTLNDHAPSCALRSPAPEVFRCTCGVRSNQRRNTTNEEEE